MDNGNVPLVRRTVESLRSAASFEATVTYSPQEQTMTNTMTDRMMGMGSMGMTPGMMSMPMGMMGMGMMPGMSGMGMPTGMGTGMGAMSMGMVPRCTMKMEKVAGGMRCTCTCDDKTAAEMMKNLCMMMQGGMCSMCCMMNGMMCCCCNLGVMGTCQMEMTEMGCVMTCTSGDASCAKMIQGCCDCMMSMMMPGCSCCMMMNGMPVCCMVC